MEQNRVLILDGWRGWPLSGFDWALRYVDGINFGRIGVELFIVLSGRLMAEILFVRQAPLREFFDAVYRGSTGSKFFRHNIFDCISLLRQDDNLQGGRYTILYFRYHVNIKLLSYIHCSSLIN